MGKAHRNGFTAILPRHGGWFLDAETSALQVLFYSRQSSASINPFSWIKKCGLQLTSATLAKKLNRR
jgi:hypothetical protein